MLMTNEYKDRVLNLENDDEYKQLYDFTSRLVFYIINRLVTDLSTTQDLVQDTYVSAFTNIESLSNKTFGGFQSWINQIATNTAKNYLKKKKPLNFTDIIDDESLDYEIEDDRQYMRPDVAANREELSDFVARLMGELPEDQRLCVFMYYYEEKTTKEISEALELSENTIKSKLRYAKEKIKSHIEHSNMKFYDGGAMLIFALGLRSGILGVLNPQPFEAIGFLAGSTIVKPRKLKKSHTTKTAVTTTVAVLGIASIFAFMNPKKAELPIEVNVFDYVDISYSGYDGEGVAHLSLMASQDETLNSLLDTLTFEISEKELLTNGDEIHVRFENLDSTKYNWIETSKNYTVQGLTEIEVVNLRDLISLTFDGFNTQGSAKWALTDLGETVLSNIDHILISKNSSLSNGDEIVLSLSKEISKDQYRIGESSFSAIIEGLEEIPKETDVVMFDTLEDLIDRYGAIQRIDTIVSNTSVDINGKPLDNLGDLMSIDITDVRKGFRGELEVGIVYANLNYQNKVLRYVVEIENTPNSYGHSVYHYISQDMNESFQFIKGLQR